MRLTISLAHAPLSLLVPPATNVVSQVGLGSEGALVGEHEGGTYATMNMHATPKNIAANCSEETNVSVRKTIFRWGSRDHLAKRLLAAFALLQQSVRHTRVRGMGR